MMSMPAPAANPTTTESETKLTSIPRRATPMTMRSPPDMTASIPAACTVLTPAGRLITPRTEATRIEAVFVGPVCRCFDDPTGPR